MGPIRKTLFALTAIILTSCSFFANLSKAKQERSQDELMQWMKENKKLRVCATTPLVADVVHRVGKEHIVVISLMGKQMDPHSYNIVKGDKEKLDKADIIFANGLSLEHTGSMQKALESHKDKVVYLSDAVPKNEVIYVSGSPDPHIWMDIALWAKTVDVIESKLKSYDPDNAQFYTENAIGTKGTFDHLHRMIKASMGSIPAEKRHLVTSHDAFNYYARAYLGTKNNYKDTIVAIQGLSPTEEISHAEIKRVLDYIKKYKVKTIFAEKNLSRDSLKKVVDACKKSGIEVKLADEDLYGDSPGEKTYVQMMQINSDRINENLGGNKSSCGCY